MNTDHQHGVMETLEDFVVVFNLIMACSRTDKMYPVRNTAKICAGVEKGHAEFLNSDGSIKDPCIRKVI
jgi:hypothetical protein